MKNLHYLLLLSLLLASLSCEEQNDISNPTTADIELKNVSAYDLDLSFSKSRTSGLDIESVDLLNFEREGQEYAVNTVSISTDDPTVRKLILLSPDNEEIYSIVKIQALGNGTEKIEYFDWNGNLYMSGIQEETHIQVTSIEDVNYLEENGRVAGWGTAFGECIGYTVGIISSNAVYSGAIGLGLAMGYAPYIAAGLAIGCGIYAAGGSAISGVNPNNTLPNAPIVAPITLAGLQRVYSNNQLLILKI